MSDDSKPHDEHGHHAGHDDHGHGDHGHHDAHAPAAAHGHDDHGHGHGDHGHAAHGHDDHGHAAHADHGHDDHGHGHADHAHAPAAHAHDDQGHGHDDHGHAAHGHDDHGHAAPADHGHAAHDDHGHGHEAHAAAHGHDDHGHGHEAHAAHAAPQDHGHHDAGADARIAAAAAAGAAAAAASKPPVWSDSGDAPFEEAEAAPVYARGGKGRKKKAKSGGGETFEIIKTIVFALLIALVLRVLLFQPFTIPSASMEPNLYEGDYIVVSKWSYGYSKHAIPFSPPVFEGRLFGREPERGDIVVFKLPRDNRTDYIKRVIGLPGDRVQMIANVLHINGQPVRDVAITGPQLTDLYGQVLIQADETLPEGKTFRTQEYGPGHDLDDTAVFEVPEGYYFMMGDNRDNSVDSRVDMMSNGVGLVPAENLIGKAEIILFSWSPGASLWNPVTWFANVRPSRFFTVLN